VGDAKALVLRPIQASEANALVRRVHYSGKVVNNSQLHIGVFWNGRLEGAMQFGPPMDKRKIAGLVRGSEWHHFLELNRMAFGEALPRNSESRALGIAFRLLRKHAPQVKWIVSFADGTQCGDGTIYRASGFVLTLIKPSENLIRLPSGAVIHKMTLESNPTAKRPELGGRSYYEVTGGRYNLRAYTEEVGGVEVPGYQFRYIRFIDPAWADRLTVPVIPFDKIPDECRMYRGEKMTRAGSSEPSGCPPEVGGAAPTPALHLPSASTEG